MRQNISANDLISKTKICWTTSNSKAFATQKKEIKIVGDSGKNEQIKVF